MRILLNLDRYRESVSIISPRTTARPGSCGIANARARRFSRPSNASSSAAHGQRLLNVNQRLLAHGALDRASVGAVGLVFVLTLAYLLWSINRLFTSLRGSSR
jgi:hypothetical protein